MNKTLISIIAFLLISLTNIENAMSQITLQCVKPGQQLTIAPENDTLWVINDYRMRKAVETGRLYKFELEKNQILSQKCDTLNEIITQKDSLIATIKADRGYYETELKDCRQDTQKAGDLAKKYQKRAKFATIGCVGAAAIGFVVGILIAK
ncbi:MAG: hypothetical protein MJ211_06595 [Bacteroidales bacterium]|nr:hypothetical protein [Bacteroidales bacterium]